MTPRLNIRTRLLVLLLPALLAVVLISAALTYFIALHVATMAYDRALIDPALAMAPHLSLDENGQMKFDLPRIAQQVLLIDSKDEMFFRILDSQGRTIAGESDLPAARAGIHEVSYFDSMIHGRPIRVVALPVPLTAAGAKGPMAVVEAAETTAKRQHLLRAALLANLVPSLMLATLTMVLVWFGVAWGLVPLNRLRQDLAMRSHRDLRPVPVDRSPEETRPLVEAINDLLLRLREAIGVQQRFIANA
ncbi:MAG: sensor histidine kinase N-terminal domain-containing protein, partial [Proteobacteria bacterium]|nr:sensor histidine kinase N-terminal domain-containing protein [Pseudomonadota bacterium]